MSRIDCELGGDRDCIAGYDLATETFFFHSGREDARGRPKIRAGHAPGAAPTIAALEAAIAKASGRKGFSFPDDLRGALRSSATNEIVAAHMGGRLGQAKADELLDLVGEVGEQGEADHAGA